MREDVKIQLLKFKKEQILPYEIVEKWKKLDLILSNNELAEIVQWLIQDDVFWWLFLISHILPQIVTHQLLLNLISTIADRTRGDLAQGPFINALISIGENQPIITEELYSTLMVEYPKLYDYAGLLLGGAARKNESLRENILTKITEKSGKECESLIRGLRVAFEKSIHIDPRVFLILRKLTEKGESIIKPELSLAYFTFYTHDKYESFNQLSKLSRSSDPIVRYAIANQLSMCELDIDHLLELVGILADDTELIVLDRVTWAIANKCSNHANFCLSIIKKWVDSGKYLKVKNISWTLNKIGETNFKHSTQIVKNWFKEYDWRMELHGPEIIWELGAHDVEYLLNVLLSWLQEKDIRNAALEGIRKVLSERYKISEEEDKIINICYSGLYNLAISENLYIDKVVKRENLKIFKCCALIEYLKKEKLKIDFDIIISNLKHFPHIKEFLGLKWFDKEKNEQNIEHPLLIYLSRDLFSDDEIKSKIDGIKLMENKFEQDLSMMKINDSIKIKLFLLYLDKNISSIKHMKYNIRLIRRGLQETDKFWQTVSEIDVISRLQKRYKVIIAPQIKLKQEKKVITKKPDLMVNIKSDQILLEVITPEMFAPLKYFHAAGIPNRLKSKIYTEFKKHFKGQIIERDVIIVVDIGLSEIRYESAESYLEGSYQLTLRIDKETGKVIDTFPSRADDSMQKLDLHTRVIIGLILYRRITGTNGIIHIRGRSFANETVMNKNRRKLLTKITNTLLG
jgi:hypothetical protein